MLLGCAYHGLGQAEGAWHCFNMILQRLEHEPDAMESIFQMPLRHGLSKYSSRKAHLSSHARRPSTCVSWPCSLGSVMPGLGAQSFRQKSPWLSSNGRRPKRNSLGRWLCSKDQRCRLPPGASIPRRPDSTSSVVIVLRRRRYWTHSAAVLTQLADSLGSATELRRSLLAYLPVAYRARA